MLGVLKMPPALRCRTTIPSVSSTKRLCNAGQQSSRSFSITPRNDQRVTRARRQFFRWLGTQGQNFRNPVAGSTNYLGAYTPQGELRRVLEEQYERQEEKQKEEAAKAAGRPYEASKPRAPPRKEIPEPDPYEAPKTEKKWKKSKDQLATEGSDTVADGRNIRAKSERPGKSQPVEGAATLLPPERAKDLMPFPLNPNFVSQPVLSDKYRKKIWEEIMLNGKSVREVSAELGVEMSRVGAVVRLIEVEKSWLRMGKPLALPYAEAVTAMLPKTLYIEDQLKPHESINDLPVHRATGPQIFHPTSESRHFTREDAARVFDEKLLPADLRIPHPELVVLHKEVIEGLPEEVRLERAAEREAVEEKKRARTAELQAKKDAAIKRVDIGRWEYRFTEISANAAGKDGRGLKGVGWRYGKPHMDRSRGAFKIPQAVE